MNIVQRIVEKGNAMHILTRIRKALLPPKLRNYDMDELCYCVELKETLALLESQLHISDDPYEIAVTAMRAACGFYQADWSGLLEIDTDLGIWTPFWWYNTNPEDKTTRVLNEFESSQFLERWVCAMRNNNPIIVPDAETIRKEYPKEYAVYNRLQVYSVLGVPIKPRPVAFLVVRNPKRYITDSSMLQFLGVVILNAVNERKMMDSAKNVFSPASIQNDKEIYIKFFGSMAIFTSKGILSEQDLKAPKCAKVATYLMLNRKATHPPLEIAEALWPDDTSGPDALSSNIRGLIYRFRQAFSAISDFQLIESSPNGYCINSELQVKSDLQQFDRLWTASQNATATTRKVELLKQAVELYTGPVYENACDEHWIVSIANHYSLRYIGIVNELMSKLADAGDYSGMQHYATRALEIEPGNMIIRYWLVYAMYKLGSVEMAKNEIERSKSTLTVEEYDVLLRFLKQNKDLQTTI